jgi:hypothetical protein
MLLQVRENFAKAPSGPALSSKGNRAEAAKRSLLPTIFGRLVEKKLC